MKNILIFFASMTLIFSIGCSDDASVTSPTDGGFGIGDGGGTGTGGGSVTFQIANQVKQEGYDFDSDGQTDDSFYLTATPSVSVKINSVNIEIPNDANFDTVQGDGTTVFAANQAVQINTTPYYNVGSGQKFTLKISGKLASDDQAFDVTVEYTVP